LTLRFPYLNEPLSGQPPPSLPATAIVRWRPLIPVTIMGPSGLGRDFGRAVVDPAADDTVFPLDTAWRIGTPLFADTSHRVRWRGQSHPLRFAQVDLILTDASQTFRWPAIVGFSPAPIRYPILGQAGCLQFLDATFFGGGRSVHLETNSTYPGTLH
jgi:hypothetical protein